MPFSRSNAPTFGLQNMFYASKLLPQLTVGRSQEVKGDLNIGTGACLKTNLHSFFAADDI